MSFFERSLLVDLPCKVLDNMYRYSGLDVNEATTVYQKSFEKKEGVSE